MTNLQKIIRENREEFDDQEPAEGHFDRFAARLEQQPVTRSLPGTPTRMLKIAAVIVILITLSVGVFDLATREIREHFANAGQESELPLEIREAVQYYDNQATIQLATINKLAGNQGSAATTGATAMQEIQVLDTSTEDLKKSLAADPGNEHILDAIIRNQQMKETMLNTIITQLSQAKKY
jgi:hypothetical protein